MAGNPTVEVQEYGQSLWYDNISRAIIKNGELQKLIDEYGILGVTSNPSIFQKAIGESDDYDEGLMTLLDLEPYDIYERLAIEDIQNALDILRPIYDKTNRRDGYVSLEVSPLIANDTDTTISEARRLFETVDRPNTMIKIPATPAGIPAIEEAIASGLNINVTLIFSVKNYEAVTEAYIRGLERRLAAGEDVTHIASVASFFLSRIDVAVDQALEHNIHAAQGRDLDRVAANRRLLGKAAIANAKLAYQSFERIFQGQRFAELREAGAQVQRPLWASTSTKNPNYPDTMYIDNLIAPHTVNTVPHKTLMAFKDHGTVKEMRMDDDDIRPQDVIDMLAEVGIDIEEVTQRLQEDGVDAFVDSFENLLSQVEAKRNILKTGVIERQLTALSTYSDAVEETIAQLEAELANQRIWSHDGTFWKTHATTVQKINNRLGWLDVQTTIDRARLQHLQDTVHNEDITHVVLLGMGGSSLAPDVLHKTFGHQAGFPAFLMLDSTDPAYIKAIEEAIDIRKTLFLVASKSGGTLETLSFFKYFYQQTGENGAQFIAITDPGSGLEALAKEKNFRDIFLNPVDIGGRYSALSYFGMVPAALMGLDLERLWAEADRMMLACAKNIPAKLHPGIWLGAVMGVLAKEGRDKISIFTTSSIASFGAWAEQLIAESTGKEGRGIVPVVGATVGNPHDYNTDRLFVYLRVADDADVDEMDAGVRTLREAGHPRLTFRLDDKYAIAGEFFRWEYATAVAGKLLDINPFDEPNVTESKNNTSRLLEYFEAHGSLPQSEPIFTEDGVSLYVSEQEMNRLSELCSQHNYNSDEMTSLLAAQINGTRAGDYFALLAYVPMTDEIDAMLSDIRRRLRHTTKRAVTVGYGPRFLHSTGQLHKGGPNNGVFIQITHDDAIDLAIPGAPYTFGILKTAQADGDLESLNNKNRRVMRLHIQGDIVQGLQKLVAAIEFARERRQ
ncbi:MAG: bifunctional transaldolase/phosoglucose isomerase [Chloroflexi bacterium]|nr:MAG: bifunctional transaldolase/phosoglucose isomerase [Chloroflexota bacterium]